MIFDPKCIRALPICIRVLPSRTLHSCTEDGKATPRFNDVSERARMAWLGRYPFAFSWPRVVYCLLIGIWSIVGASPPVTWVESWDAASVFGKSPSMGSLDLCVHACNNTARP